MNCLLLFLPLMLLGCDDAPSQICRDGIIYYKNSLSESVYTKGTLECINLKKEEK
jgi:hypothetical protein